MKVLVTAASKEGATAEIAEAIAGVLGERGLETTAVAPEEVRSVEEFGAVVLGSAVYVGHWLEPAKDFVHRFAAELATRPVWLFSSGPVGDPEGRLTRSMDVDSVDIPKIVEETKAREHVIFAGRLTPGASMNVVQRLALRFFPKLRGDFRDWGEIRAWAGRIAEELDATER